MKKISILIPTYNEHENINIAYNAVTELFEKNLPNYDYDIIFVDNCSTDDSRSMIRRLAEQDKEHIKAIFNARNFGQARSHFYGLTQADGDCAVLLHADLQNPPEVILEFVKKWEDGAKNVIGINDNSKENPILFFLRT